MAAYNLFNFVENFVVSLPKSLHRELVEVAERNGVSLNAFVNVALAKAVDIKQIGGGMISVAGGTFPVKELVSRNA